MSLIPRKEVREVSDIAEDNMNWRIKLILMLVKKWDFLLVARCGEMGCVTMNADDDSQMHLRAILHSAFENGQDNVKSVILGASEDWLKEREIETRNFIERIK